MNSITESQLKNIIIESVKQILEYQAPKKIRQAEEDFAKKLYGDEYGKLNQEQSDIYQVPVTKNADVKAGLFSVGNQKLSDDTLIINFTSALGCPSMNNCPITQKACYAVAGENRLEDTRRKNLIVQNLWMAAQNKNMLQGLFDIAELYIIQKAKTKKPIRYIRYNEAGGFMNQNILRYAAKFSKYVKEKYHVDSMAYTAKKQLDITEPIDGVPIDQIIKINTSVDTIKHSEGAVKSDFFGIPMRRPEDPDKNLENNDKTEYITDNEMNKLSLRKPMQDEEGKNSIPVLTKGKWSGGEGYYYVCPCSFWKWNKDKATEKYFEQIGLTNGEQLSDADRKRLLKQINPSQKQALDKFLKTIKSPCGIECAVCHNMQGGIDPANPEQKIMDYTVLTATHGAGAANYDDAYALAKRGGSDTAVYKGDKSNPKGRETKYLQNKKHFDMDAYLAHKQDAKNRAQATKAQKQKAAQEGPQLTQGEQDFFKNYKK